MDLHLRVELDGDEPVVVKAGRGPAAAARLRQEHRRLLAARHPGVVALAASADLVATRGDGDGDGETVELRTVHAGEPVASWTGTAASIAGLVAAVASTLGDLHELGIVHGRVDTTHVLIGDDGRPRLCGFAGDEGATPADDVAALGRVLADLADRARPPRRRLTRPRADRDLRALHQIAARATDPVATRRPSARVLAAALLEAVPDAALPAGDRPSARRAARAGRVTSTDTFERIWRLADVPPEHERWAAAVGSGPWARPPTVPEGDEVDGDPDTDEDARTPADEHARTSPDEDARTPADEDARPPGDTWPPAKDDTGERPVPLALTTTPPWGHPRPGPGGPEPDEPWSPGADRPHHRRPPRPARRLARAGGAAPAPPARVAAVPWAPPGHAPADADAGAPPAECPPVAPPTADVDGDGCPEALSAHGTIVDAGVARWSLGEEGDHVALGDWDCDGQATPALLRPATGDVFVFDGWAAAGEPLTVAPTARVEGAAGIRAEAGTAPCDRLVVELASGEARPIEVGG